MSPSVFFVVLAALLWGTTGTAAFFVGTDVSPVAIGAATMGFGGVLLAALGGRACLGVLADRGARIWVGLGVLGVVVYPLTFYAGMALAGITLGNLVALGLGPIAVALLEWGVDKSTPTKRWWGAVVLAITGVIVMSTGSVELGGDRVSNVAAGLSLAVIAGLSYGLFTYAFGRLIDRGHTPKAVVGAVFGSGSPALLIVVAVIGGGLFASPLTTSLVAYLVVGPMAIAYLAFSRALQTLRSSTVAGIALLEPVAAGALAFLVVGEILGPLAGFGGVLVLVSLAVIGTEKSDRPAR